MPPSPQVITLRGMEGKAREFTEGPDLTTPVTRPDRARGVLDDNESAAIGEVKNPVHVGR